MTRKAALMVCACGLALMPALVPVPALSDYVTPDDARYAAAKQRYDEQEALPVPTTKADLTLNCSTFGGVNWTIQVWFGAALLTWGTGEDRQIWRLDRVSPAEITFKRVLQDWPKGKGWEPGRETFSMLMGTLTALLGITHGGSMPPTAKRAIASQRHRNSRSVKHSGVR